MEEQKEFSVFDDAGTVTRHTPDSNVHNFIYYVFTGYFFIKIFLYWGYFFTFRSLAIGQSSDPIIQAFPLYLIPALATTAVVLTSIVLFCRGSLRAAIALLILAALLEMACHYLLKN